MVVDLGKKICTCMPCVHACAAISRLNGDPEDYCHSWGGDGASNQGTPLETLIDNAKNAITNDAPKDVATPSEIVLIQPLDSQPKDGDQGSYHCDTAIVHCQSLVKSSARNDGKNAFSELEFSNWKKVNNGINCAFVCHEGSIPNSPHNLCVKSCDDLMAQSKHIDKILDRHSNETIANNRLRLKTSINAIRWLAFQVCAFRGDDESPGSLNRENFIELIKLLASCNQNVHNVVLENAPGNAQYISLSVQKDILYIFSRKVRATIREKNGDSKFCIIIDEARDESKREQMYVVLRFVDKHGCVQERFFDLIHVSDTCSLTLKTEISSVLSRHNLDVQNLRGQGYDGASNMRGEWRLQALFLKDCLFAYYIHCLAHRLQLALVSAAKEVCYVHQFFSKLTLIVNVVTVSPKRHDQLRVAQANNVANLIANDQIVTGSGLNQIGTLQRARDTRWGSHLNSVHSLLCMFDATCEVLEKNTEKGNFSTRGDASAAYDAITSFEFVFVLHLKRNILEVSHDLCQALQ
ncbi:uncharacterized protein LOC107473499 [Arachis duranensis]|uniref:Uncharacterized protein LOC107473499 n=1 Tax=Arachis duranensis TaxID=130453 RepID=A0A6P4CBI7_ARADU|nr:uncharacterized protein LOC107473499 [Arachis duranensis]